jgi:hypothetical protein
MSTPEDRLAQIDAQIAATQRSLDALPPPEAPRQNPHHLPGRPNSYAEVEALQLDFKSYCELADLEEDLDGRLSRAAKWEEQEAERLMRVRQNAEVEARYQEHLREIHGSN